MRVSSAGHASARGARMTRAPRAVWNDHDTEVLKWVVSFYEYRHVDYAAIARFFIGRTAKDVKKRCAVLRDRERRLKHRHAWNGLAVESCDAPSTPQNVPVVPHAGRLHPTLVWQAAEWHDLETLKL